MTASPPVPVLEICVDSPAAALAAQRGGADRVELCAGLAEGGLTPSLGAIEAARARIDIELFVLVRPRGGDFLCSPSEFQVMRRDIELCAEAGAQGVVLGVLRPDGTVDSERTAQLVAHARPLLVTFHRAFDMTRDPEQSLEELVELGVDRVLTSGAERTALEGAERIARLVELAGERIAVLPGGGIRASNVRELLRRTGAREVHCTARSETESPMEFRNPRCTMGAQSLPGEFVRRLTESEIVRQVRMAARGEDGSPVPPPGADSA